MNWLVPRLFSGWATAICWHSQSHGAPEIQVEPGDMALKVCSSEVSTTTGRRGYLDGYSRTLVHYGTVRITTIESPRTYNKL